MRRFLLTAILAAFSVLTALALWRHGYWGMVAPQLENLAGIQVLTDLVIALTLVMLWIWRDAQAAGRNPWPWLVLTLVAGSYGPLFYLLFNRQGDEVGR